MCVLQCCPWHFSCLDTLLLRWLGRTTAEIETVSTEAHYTATEACVVSNLCKMKYICLRTNLAGTVFSCSIEIKAAGMLLSASRQTPSIIGIPIQPRGLSLREWASSMRVCRVWTFWLVCVPHFCTKCSLAVINKHHQLICPICLPMPYNTNTRQYNVILSFLWAIDYPCFCLHCAHILKRLSELKHFVQHFHPPL